MTLVDAKTGAERELPFGACVWATGIAMHPLIKQLTEALPEGSQGHFRSVVTDEFFRVRGAERGTIYALGDAATVAQPAALGAADALFARGDADGDGRMSRDELRGVLAAYSRRTGLRVGCSCVHVGPKPRADPRRTDERCCPGVPRTPAARLRVSLFLYLFR